ncbi:N-acetylneuraminate lyase B-like, partial [Anastrepha obliqua]|uniref:N-acetylneuraminate lyase B-like n=1 Tax=Anastrepha obliqua TaxID=95512 RepID=UPI0024091BE0
LTNTLGNTGKSLPRDQAVQRYVAQRYKEVTQPPEKRDHKRSTRSSLDDEARHVSFFDFKGLMAPVFTDFKNNEEQTLEIENIDRYAEWLSTNRISGILVNAFTGEGPALGLSERIRNAEAWWEASQKYNLIMFLQIGGAPLPDVLVMAEHAQKLGVHAVLCLPELFYKPTTVEQLVKYMHMVAKRCIALPFFYYHLPLQTGVLLNMSELCRKAEELIPNFYGIHFESTDLDDGEACLRDGRVIIFGNSRLLACGLMVGFESALMSFLNIRPDLGWQIWNAMLNNDLDTARDSQLLVNSLMSSYIDRSTDEGFVGAMKRWFNDEVSRGNGAGFRIGAARKFF